MDELLTILNISHLNTRIIKFDDKNYTVLIASANTSTKSHYYKVIAVFYPQDKKVTIQYGDFSAFLRRVAA